MAAAAIGMAQHLPSRIELQDRAVITAGIGMVLLDQGAIGRLDFSRTGGGRHPKDAIGIGGGDGSPPETTTIKKPRRRPGLVEGCVEKWRRKGPEMCEGTGPRVLGIRT